MHTCHVCGREGSRGFTDDNGEPLCANREQCTKRLAKAERAKLAGRCVDCLEAGDDPKGARKLATKDDGSLQPGPRCVTHWRARKKSISEQAHAQRIGTTYELTPDQYWAIYAAQGNKCFVCQKSTGKARRLAVDHDHLLALEHGHDPKQGCVRCIRALLCKRCNTLIGWLDVEALQRAIIVLTDPPARKILFPEVTQAEVDEAAAELELPAPDDIATAGEPTAIPPTLDGVTVDEQMSPELIEAIDEAAWIAELADEDGIPQSDVGIVEFFGVVSADNFWLVPE
jgi:hypothetical protein